jgi:ABC-type transporter Mla subunit MlaD
MQAAAPDDRETSVEPDANADDWARLDAALAESSAAVADGDRAELTRALISLADAARALADALGPGHAS